MKPITADPDAIAFCGLYCGACRKYRTDVTVHAHYGSKEGPGLPSRWAA